MADPKVPSDGTEGQVIPAGKGDGWEEREKKLQDLPPGGRIDQPEEPEEEVTEDG